MKKELTDELLNAIARATQRRRVMVRALLMVKPKHFLRFIYDLTSEPNEISIDFFQIYEINNMKKRYHEMHIEIQQLGEIKDACYINNDGDQIIIVPLKDAYEIFKDADLIDLDELYKNIHDQESFWQYINAEPKFREEAESLLEVAEDDFYPELTKSEIKVIVVKHLYDDYKNEGGVDIIDSFYYDTLETKLKEYKMIKHRYTRLKALKKKIS